MLVISPEFWAFVFLTYLLLHLNLPYDRSTFFGALNLIGVFFLLGVEAGVLLSIFCFWLWGTLYFCIRPKPEPALEDSNQSKRHQSNGNQRYWLGPLGSYLMVMGPLLVAFCLYKTEAPLLGRTLLFSSESKLSSVLAVLSFSYIFLRAVDATRAVCWEQHKLLSPLALLGYLAPLHMLTAGPIAPYRSYCLVDEKDWQLPEPSRIHILESLNTVVNGLFYKVVIAQSIKFFIWGTEADLLLRNPLDACWMLVYLFFDFAGYSLIAVGVGRLLFIPTPDNFRLPFLSKSVTEFWTRWHISLGEFIRTNIFFPLQLNLSRHFGRKASAYVLPVVLIVSFVFVGLWHRLSLNFLLWGFYMGIIVALEKLLRERYLRSRWANNRLTSLTLGLLGPVYVFLVLAFGIYFTADEVFLITQGN